ncbi:MAG: hypothetical protein DYG96_11515 [Chlorobi bacterium CHB2]|nr:hypothetical protein [Chlorobi bacterium CHB2]
MAGIGAVALAGQKYSEHQLVAERSVNGYESLICTDCHPTPVSTGARPKPYAGPRLIAHLHRGLFADCHGFYSGKYPVFFTTD